MSEADELERPDNAHRLQPTGSGLYCPLYRLVGRADGFWDAKASAAAEYKPPTSFHVSEVPW